MHSLKINDETHEAPWMDCVYKSSLMRSKNVEEINPNPPNSFDDEIFKLIKYVSLTQKEKDMRESLIRDLQSVVADCFGINYKVQAFGSYESNLSTFLSDVDVCIKKTNEISPLYDLDNHIQDLKKLEVALSEKEWVGSIFSRLNARVPIVCLTSSSGIQCDICWYKPPQGKISQTMVDPAVFIEKWKELYKALVFLLKIYLYQRQLDKLFSGGIGSSRLYVLIAHHFESEGISLSNRISRPGELLRSFFAKFSLSKNLNNKTRLCVDGIVAEFVTVHKMKKINAAFSESSLAIESALVECTKTESILSRVIDGHKLHDDRNWEIWYDEQNYDVYEKDWDCDSNNDLTLEEENMKKARNSEHLSFSEIKYTKKEYLDDLAEHVAYLKHRFSKDEESDSEAEDQSAICSLEIDWKEVGKELLADKSKPKLNERIVKKMEELEKLEELQKNGDG